MNEKQQETPIVEMRVMQYSKMDGDGGMYFSHYVMQYRTAGSSTWQALPIIHHVIDEDGNVHRR